MRDCGNGKNRFEKTLSAKKNGCREVIITGRLGGAKRSGIEMR